MNRNKPMKRITILSTLFLLSVATLFSQADSRYDSGKNLPFNEKAGDVNPQTGDITIQASDVSLPGRAGMNFSFGRIWKTNQSNVFAMSQDPIDGSNLLSSDTIEKVNRLGVGWSSSQPYMLMDSSSGSLVINLFLGGGAYEVDQTGVQNRNLTKSNLLGYDLLDKRIYEDSSYAYSDGPESVASLSAYSVADLGSVRNKYELLLKDNSQYLFRADGKIMVHIDKSGLNKIWYYYDAQDRLALVIDSIGHKIAFTYDVNGNLSQISWDVESHRIGLNGVRESYTETKTVTYAYKSGLDYPEVNNLKPLVNNFVTPYALESFTDAQGNVTKYVYDDKKANFTFDSNKSHWSNVFLLLTSERNNVHGADLALNERHFEYKSPDNIPYRKFFYSGYMDYFKLSRRYNIDRNARIVGEANYIYHDNYEAGNSNQYTTIITIGNSKQTYTYSVSSDPSKNDVLKSIETSTADGYLELKNFVYNNDRAKTLEEVNRQGNLAFGQQFFYDTKGNLKEHTGPMGLVTVKLYDDKYSIPVRETRILGSGSGQTEYDMERIINNKGQVTDEILYVKEGATTKALTTKYSYDAFGNMIKTVDPGGIASHTVFDPIYNSFPIQSYQMVKEDDYLSKVDENYWFEKPDTFSQVKLSSWRVFNSDGSPWIEVDSEGFAIEHYYDKKGAEILTVFPDENDTLLSGEDVTDIQSHTLFAAFLTGRNHNPSVKIEIDYDKAFVKTFTDFEYNDTTKVWTQLVTAVQQDGVGNVSDEISYGEAGAVHAVKSMTYDLLGRMVSLTDPDAQTSFSTIFVNGVETKRYDKTWLVKYDDLGRTIKVLYPQTAEGTKIKEISYNDRENSIETVDPEGKRVYERMDWNGNTVEMIAYGDRYTSENEKQIYTMEYDQLNRLTKSTDPEGLVTTYRFDERNLLLEQSYGNGSDLMVYNDRGLLISKSDRKNQKITFNYDAAGRNTKTIYYRADDTIYEREFRMYDRRGNVIRVENKSIIEHSLFDGAGRLSDLNRRVKDAQQRNSISSVYGGDILSQKFNFSYEYTASGLLNQMIYPDGAVHNFTYDTYLAQLATIGEGADLATLSPFVTNLDYNKSGVVTKMDYSNGTTQTWDFDNRKRIKRIRIGKIATPDVFIEDLNYRIDGSGNIKSINENTYTYDGFNRIATANTKYPEIADQRAKVEEFFGTYNGGEAVEGKLYNAEADLSSVTGRVNGEDYLQALILLENAATSTDGFLPFDRESFTYDKNGNRLKLIQNGDQYIYTYGLRNRLEKIELKKEGEQTSSLYASYTYDENGNTTKRIIHGLNGVETVEFKYDVINRLVKTIRGTESSEYFYDNAGNRFLKTSSDGDMSFYLRHGTISVAMDMEIYSDQSSEKGKINRYVLSGDLVAGRITTIVKADNTKTTEKNYYHLDHLNSTKVVTDILGEVVVNYTYRAFGEQLKKLDKSNNETDDLGKYSYGGKELDEDINLYYFNARFYDATTGRFINVDPIQDGTNWYVYCANNPLNRTDPTGLNTKKSFFSMSGTQAVTMAADFIDYKVFGIVPKHLEANVILDDVLNIASRVLSYAPIVGNAKKAVNIGKDFKAINSIYQRHKGVNNDQDEASKPRASNVLRSFLESGRATDLEFMNIEKVTTEMISTIHPKKTVITQTYYNINMLDSDGNVSTSFQITGKDADNFGSLVNGYTTQKEQPENFQQPESQPIKME